MLGSFKILKRMNASFKLDLSDEMNIHSMFHISLFRKDSNDSHSEQNVSSSSLIIIDEEEKYDVENIINFRLINRDINKRLQYKINWIKHFSDRKWYSIENFENIKEIIVDFHARYFNKLDSHFISISFIKHISRTNSLADVKILIKEILNKMKKEMNDITKQTSIVINTIASIETILSHKQTIQNF
jgi:hypothetical protein